ncbi:MAG: glycosyltransferase family 2 protein [Desulfobacterales bacterium]|nr:glycosyltransferase family 2 protein [Desulfobacterales bacterium]
MNYPVFSIIIPAYNASSFIDKALESVLFQTVKNYEVIVIDDNSTDNTVEIVSKYLAHFQKGQLYILKALPNHPPGPAAVRNTGLKTAKSEFIAFLDADDYWEPDHLENAYKAFCSYPEIVVYYALGQAFDSITYSKIGLIGYGPDQYDASPFNCRSFILQSDPMPTSTVCAKKQAIKTFSGFEERLTGPEDWWLWICLSTQGLFYFNNNIEAYYRVSDDSLTGSRNEVNSIISAGVLADVAMQRPWLEPHEKRYLHNLMIKDASARIQHYIRVCDRKVISKIYSHIVSCPHTEKLVWLQVMTDAFAGLMYRAYRSVAVRLGLLSKENQFKR